jgi:hypothetical protein
LARLIQSFEMGQLLANAADSIEEVRQVARGAIKGRDEALQVARSALEGRERSGELFITALSQRTGASADVIRGVIDEFEKAEDKGND